MAKITKLSQLTPDGSNLNKGTERGNGMLEHSLRSLGAGRSILIDCEGRIIAGNKTVEMAAACGIDRVIVVETDGRTIVAVQRTDLDLETDPRAKQMALADNRVAEVNLDWDANQLAALNEEMDLSKFFGEAELKGILGEQLEAADFECCSECGRKMAKNRSKVVKSSPPVTT